MEVDLISRSQNEILCKQMMGSDTRRVLHDDLIPKLPLEVLPTHIKDIQIVDLYAVSGVAGDDWKARAHLNDQGEAWVITPLHYSGSRITRKASGGGTWDERTRELIEKDGDASWYQRKYKFVQATNERRGLQKYTMMEYTLDEDKPKFALCRITVDNKKSAHDRPPWSSQKPKSMKFDYADTKKGDKGETSLSHEPMQQGGNFENASGYYCQPDLEGKLRELRQHFSDAHILQVFSQIMGEKIPATSPKKQSTEVPVRNFRKRRHCTDMNTMKADTSTQRQEQAKVEKLGSNAAKDEPEFLDSPNSMNQNNGGRLDHQMVELNADVQEANKLSHNFYANSTEQMEYSNHLPSFYQNISAPGSSTCNYTTTEGRLCHQMVELNADVQEPNKLSHNFNANSTEPMENSNPFLSHYQNINEPGQSTSNYLTTEGSLDHQMFEANADVLVHNNLSHYCKANSTEPITEIRNHLWSYNQNINVPGPSTSYATTELWTVDPSTYKDPLEEQLIPLCNTPYDGSHKLDNLPLVETRGWFHHQIAELNEDVKEHNNLSHNFKENSTEQLENSSHLLSYYQNINAPGPSTTNSTTEPGTLFSGGLDLDLNLERCIKWDDLFRD